MKGWVAGLVGRGVLVRTGGDGRGGGGDRDGEGEGEEGRRWEWNEAVVAEWRGDKTRLGVWVRENLWRRQVSVIVSFFLSTSGRGGLSGFYFLLTVIGV